MKKRIPVMIPLLLCAVLLWACLPPAASAASGDPNALPFSTFAQLKDLASKTYAEPAWATYSGSGPLILVDSLSLPENLYLDARGSQIVVPSNVRFSASARNFSGYVMADEVHIAGEMTCDNLLVVHSLSINGVLINNNLISVSPETVVTGAEKITHAQPWSLLSCLCPVESVSQLKQLVDAAEAAKGDHRKYLLVLDQEEMTLEESLSVPENCELYIYSRVTVAQDCILDLNCRTWLYSQLTLDGTLINRGELNIHSAEGGSLRLQKQGNYLSEGTILCYSPSSGSLSEILTGFDLSGFETTTHSAPLFCRILRDSCGHSIDAFVPSVTPPSCTEAGYTTYTCSSCGDHYMDDLTAPSGVHTYTDDRDTTCNLCGAMRDIPLRTAPLFRLYNPYTLEHLFTSSPEERDMLAGIGWIFEGVAWYVPDAGIPVYRLYNPYDDGHFYTISSEEIDTLLPLGWQLDGVMCYSTPPEYGEPILRLFNPYEAKNYHHYTISEAECDMLVPLGWILEGTAWSGIPE